MMESESARLSPFIDEYGLLRVGGRLANFNFPYDKKYAIILPPKHHLTTLIMRHEHSRLIHAGPQQIFSSFCGSFCAVKSRVLTRKVVFKGVTCFRNKPTHPVPIVENLPSSRTAGIFPCHTCGVDYVVPILIKDKRGRGGKSSPAYISLFICFSTKAIRLELVSDLTSECFLAAFWRFVSRIGKPSHIYSDMLNGKTFIGPSSWLLKLGEFLVSENQSLLERIADDRVSWEFIPAYAPHMGGLWETGVKSCKYHLKRVIGNAL